jgi:hypothetical protein
VFNDFLVLSEREKHWFGVGILRVNKTRSILFLLGERVLMLLDAVVLVVVNRCKSEDTLLGVCAESLLIDVHSLAIVLLQKASSAKVS